MLLHRNNRRTGFTLIELLVVISIIVLLASLGIWGVFAMVGAQQRRNTENTLRVVNKMLQNQWNNVVAEARKETPSPAALLLASGDTERAKIIWIKARLMEAFPVTYNEVVPANWAAVNYAVGQNVLAGNAIYRCFQPITAAPASTTSPPFNPNYWISLIPPDRFKPHFIKYQATLQGKTGGTPGESSACLLLALKTLQAEGVAIDDQIKYAVADTDADGIPELIDGWNKPLTFSRFTTGPGVQAANPATAGSRSAKFADPIDSEGRLLTTGWYNAPIPVPPFLAVPPPPPMRARDTFEAAIHSISPDNGATAWYVIPAIASSGPDGDLTKIPDNIYSYLLRGE